AKQTLIEGRKEPYVEYGEDIAEDIVGCSKKYPPGLTRNKDYSKRGVFIVYGKRFEECSPEEQRTLLANADKAHRDFCRQRVNKGDQLHDRAKMTGKGGPLQMHREAALFLARTDPKLADRPWVTNRESVYEAEDETQSCKFCGSTIKKNVPICPVCHKVINKKLLAELESASEIDEELAVEQAD